LEAGGEGWCCGFGDAGEFGEVVDCSDGSAAGRVRDGREHRVSVGCQRAVHLLTASAHATDGCVESHDVSGGQVVEVVACMDDHGDGATQRVEVVDG